jgi:uncharacterized protein YutE (UPF0331/DUF86 family)
VVNRETILDILETLAEYVDELKSYRALPREKVLGDRQVQSAVRYAFQTAIQCALDAGLHILVDSGLASPRDNKEILQALGEKRILPVEFAKRIEGMAGFRNILVHRYFKVDSEIVYRHLQDHIGDFEEILRRLHAYVDQGSPQNE